LEAKFGAGGLKLMPKARTLATAAELRKFLRHLGSAENLAAARRYFG
jgi:hypothetical protein